MVPSKHTDLDRAKALLEQGDYTCVLCREDGCHTSRARGVRPLLTWLEGETLAGYSAADKVVGKAAAFLYVLLGVSAVHGRVMSKPARDVLDRHGIAVTFDTLVEAIRNRTNTGFCPMERSVWEIQDPQKALSAIQAKFKELNP